MADRPARERDTGIDLVGIERDGGVCAIQCKFIPPGQSDSKPVIDSLLSAPLGSSFALSRCRLLAAWTLSIGRVGDLPWCVLLASLASEVLVLC
ncbi:hypothetical protein [Ferrimicrobium sp.]|uniref:restriction endonuclease n=1 Tax=Ferrimicrobium sp. TaxID=2926050 RepID=UPI00345DAA5A